jgi:hypothetical protein
VRQAAGDFQLRLCLRVASLAFEESAFRQGDFSQQIRKLLLHEIFGLVNIRFGFGKALKAIFGFGLRKLPASAEFHGQTRRRLRSKQPQNIVVVALPYQGFCVQDSELPGPNRVYISLKVLRDGQGACKITVIQHGLGLFVGRTRRFSAVLAAA